MFYCENFNSSFKSPGMKHVFRASGFSLFKPEETQFFIDVITTTLRDRQANGGSTRNDLIDMMLKAMKGDISDLDENTAKEQFDLDSELKNHQRTQLHTITWLDFLKPLFFLH